MAATVVGAMFDAIRALSLIDDPKLWFDELPDGLASSFPNAGLQQNGETTDYHSAGGVLTKIATTTKLRLHVVNAGLNETDVLAQQIRDALLPTSLTVAGAYKVTLIEDAYNLGAAKYRNVELKAVFDGVIDFTVSRIYGS